LIEEKLNAAVQLCIFQGDLKSAYTHSEKLAQRLGTDSAHYSQQEYSYSHFQVLNALDRKEEAQPYLRRAYDWIMLVADNIKNKEWREA